MAIKPILSRQTSLIYNYWRQGKVFPHPTAEMGAGGLWFKITYARTKGRRRRTKKMRREAPKIIGIRAFPFDVFMPRIGRPIFAFFPLNDFKWVNEC